MSMSARVAEMICYAAFASSLLHEILNQAKEDEIHDFLGVWEGNTFRWIEIHLRAY